ncbi:type II secretion system protein [Corallincola platygyrae]|uniref:Type II secretion system protein n=1 Tax=Corallincola platygyrae TaxID=1193278 RepID=A0ABW4XR44_9GAMM
MRNQKGFTLIELVVVIIILGILAVTAAPKFIDLQGDARASTIQGMKAALEGASTLTYSKSAIAGLEKADSDCLALAGDQAAATCAAANLNEVNVVYGYPEATAVDLGKVLEIDFANDDREWDADESVANTVIITLRNTAAVDPLDDTECQVRYVEAVDENSRPVITPEVTGC